MSIVNNTLKARCGRDAHTPSAAHSQKPFDVRTKASDVRQKASDVRQKASDEDVTLSAVADYPMIVSVRE